MKIDSTVEVKLNMPRILNKVENDTFGLFMAKEWKRLIDPYTPHRDGFLERNVDLKPFAITYKMPYSRYMYYGVRFNYSKDPNQFATDHWDQKAAQTGQQNKLIRAANNYLRRLG